MMPVNDASDGSKTDAGPFEILVAMQAVKGAEEPVGIKHVKAGSIVADEPCLLFGIPAEIDDRGGQLRRELHSVVEQVLESNLNQIGIGVRGEAALNIKGDVAAGVLALEIGGDGFGDLADVNRL